MKNKVPSSDRRKPLTHKNLTLSLGGFVQPGDLFLPTRDQFLRAVMDRIVDHLSAPIGKHHHARDRY